MDAANPRMVLPTRWENRLCLCFSNHRLSYLSKRSVKLVMMWTEQQAKRKPLPGRRGSRPPPLHFSRRKSNHSLHARLRGYLEMIATIFLVRASTISTWLFTSAYE